jgi:hypothetical protein
LVAVGLAINSIWLFGGSGGWLIKKGRGRRRGERGVGIKEGEEKGRGKGGRNQSGVI